MGTLIIGAGIAGLAAALRLAHAGETVEVFEAAPSAGGKIRTLPTAAGPVDAGPTVLTLCKVFDDLFDSVGERLVEHLTLVPATCLARHFWPDGTRLDLFNDAGRNTEAIQGVFGSKSAREYRAFHAQTKRLFERFKDPMMFAPKPSKWRMKRVVLSQPALIPAMAPHLTMARNLSRQFSEPKLAQLFGRYATYVGGSPTESPALLSLIWQAEAAGVWQPKGGMIALARAIQSLAEAKGAVFRFNTAVRSIEVTCGQATGIVCQNGDRHRADCVLFNGDPAALASGKLGPDATDAVQAAHTGPRSHSALVWSFAAKPSGQPLALHNVFFAEDRNSEFEDLAAGRTPREPTLYIYAQDRGVSADLTGLERFEIIANAPPTTRTTASTEDLNRCQKQTFSTLRGMGLSFSPEPRETLTTPADFNRLFPGSSGSLYGRSPHGLMAAFKRPASRSRIPGLFLAGGGCHPGAGVPMATLSGMHAAETILQGRTSTSQSRQTATRGGTSTASPTMAPKPYRSSAS